MKRSRLVLGGSILGAAALILTPTAATATPKVSAPIASGLVGPLQIDVGHRGQVYVAQDFAGVLTKVRTNGTTKDLYATPGQEIAGVASRGWDVAFTGSNGSETAPPTLTYLALRTANGKVHQIADLLKFEQTRNPDQHNTYGFLNLSPSCAAQVPPEIGGQPYQGIVDSHPYALANARGGGWYVADAAANAILHVSRGGHISVVAVLPPQKIKVTADEAAAMGLPDCTVHKTYAFEPVPTDVEVAKNGSLVVSLLPGGPEDASLGARGSVVRIKHGHVKTVARGFLGATNVAIGPKGQIFVAELFAGQVSVIRGHHARPFVSLPSPASVEYARGRLYVSINAVPGASGPPDGQIVTIKF